MKMCNGFVSADAHLCCIFTVPALSDDLAMARPGDDLESSTKTDLWRDINWRLCGAHASPVPQQVPLLDRFPIPRNPSCCSSSNLCSPNLSS